MYSSSAQHARKVQQRLLVLDADRLNGVGCQTLRASSERRCGWLRGGGIERLAPVARKDGALRRDSFDRLEKALYRDGVEHRWQIACTELHVGAAFASLTMVGRSSLGAANSGCVMTSRLAPMPSASWLGRVRFCVGSRTAA